MHEQFVKTGHLLSDSDAFALLFGGQFQVATTYAAALAKSSSETSNVAAPPLEDDDINLSEPV